jgi:hypothetical protein
MINEEVEAVNVHLRMRRCHFVTPVSCSTTNIKNLSATMPSGTLSQVGIVELYVESVAVDEMVEL